MSCGIAIFVKTPALSPVKTRLWPQIGRSRAEALYMASADAVASVVRQAGADASITAYWAVAEALVLRAEYWADLPRLQQGGGGLGQRMDRVYRTLRHRHHAAILLGADSPQLKLNELHRAAQWLASLEPRLVIGRAEDGGFWLFGGNTPIPPQPWAQVPYSTATTGQHFVQAMDALGHWLELEPLRDLDTAADLLPVLSKLEAIHAPTAAQARVIKRLREIARSQESAS
ncbi:MAG: DUF2064 domain-containing protein [Proteobacteria bacterium]|nr:DUF2064 domain-containing protein [Pseudomonadota bacterium]